MKNLTYTILVAALFFVSLSACSQAPKKILPRKDCFFGVHFDFHANPEDASIGQNTTTQSIDQLLTAIKPDFVQVDCKGHPGIASYPTKVGTPAKGFVKDALKIWRSETEKYGIGLYVHYSDLLDKAAIQKHPNWASVSANGTPSPELVSIFSGYKDSLLIPQLKEVISNYKVDGIWLDGGAWAVQPDYSAAAAKAYRLQTGNTTLPKDAGTSSYKSFLSFMRTSYVSYTNQYATALHKFDSKIELCSNWLFSGMAPLPVPLGIDYLSADMPSAQTDADGSIVAFNARCYSSQARRYGKAWDLMSWGFGAHGIRPIDMLCQEAAEVISEGGAWQCYFPQNHDASVDQSYVNALAQLAPFVRARQAYCQYAVPVKQVAILFSGENEFARNNGVFQNDNNTPVKNALNALLDAQYPVEVIMEHQLTTGIPAYPLIVIPELGTAKRFQAQLLKYVSDGGTVLLLGTNNIKQLASYTGISFTNESKGSRSVSLHSGQRAYSFAVPSYSLAAGAQPLQNNGANTTPVVITKAYGKGRIASFLLNRSSAGNDDSYAGYQDAIATAVKSLFPDPIVTISGSDNIHVTVMKLNNQTVINLVNATPHVEGVIAEVPSITVNLRIARPSKLTLQPDNKPLSFTYSNGVCTTQIQSIKLHEIIVAVP